MSLLNWTLSATGVQVMTDTLATDFDGSPMKFVAKVFAIPHLDLIVGGTGFHQIIMGWQHLLMSAAPGLSIDDMDEMAARALPVLWRDLFPFGDEDHLSTIRHWGWSPKEQRFVGRSYRSRDGFEPERMQEGMAFQPDPLPEHRGIQFETFDQLVEVALGQQRHGLADEPGKQTFIGGDLLTFEMSKAEDGPVVTSISKSARFADFETHMAGVREHLEWPEN